MKRSIAYIALLALLHVPAVFGQEQQAPEKGSIEIGVRQVWGEVYGRPDLPFTPSLRTSAFNEYQDVASGFFIQSFAANLDNVLGTRNYLSLQSSSTMSKDQSYLATFGQYGKFKAQFRYDQTPHIYTDTARSLFTETNPGVYTVPVALRSLLQGTKSGSIPATVSSLVPSFSFVTPAIERKAGTGLFSFNPTADLNVALLFSRENQSGSRPIGYVMNSSPSASASAGYGVELPEPINYNTTQVTFSTEYGKQNWAVQAAFLDSIFENDISSVTFDNPFNTVDGSGTPAKGRAALYPDNSAQSFNVAGAINLGKYARLMGSITPGWQHQDAAFLPYTSNSVLQAQTAALPATSPNLQRQTLAMNYTLTSHPVTNFEVTARYRQYDYNNDSAVLSFTPVQGDAAAPNLTAPVSTTLYGFNRKNVEVDGIWFFTKKNSVKVGYEWESMDRRNRDVASTSENSVISALDLNPRKDINFRLSYRHSLRTPDNYENANEELLASLRRFDESGRLRDRADATLQYSPVAALTLSASYGAIQDNYNLARNSEDAEPYGYITGTALPYYAYGLLKDISYNYNFGADYAATRKVSLFADYTREKYNTRMVSRQRNMITVGGVEVLDPASDVIGNDWTSADRNVVDTYSAGVDVYASKRIYINTFYTLSAAQGYNQTNALGNKGMFTDPTKFLVTTVMNFPETTSRIHEVGAIVKFKLTNNLMPKLEYRYQQFDNKDFQTSAMTPYMGVAQATPAAFYPYVNVMDASSARFLFMGVDNPSYRAHVMSATLEYHF